MMVSTIDPVTGSRVIDLEHHPCIVAGRGMAEVKIYSATTKQAYLLAQPQDPVGRITDSNADSSVS